MVEWRDVAMYGAPLIAMLAAGKALRRVLLLPLEWTRNKLGNRALDTIVEEVEKDLGIDKPTIPDQVE